ncbi:arginase family protein [Streptacidiphilus sp. N1-3]|uniref:Arginase family protein n=1 Tax=Streptacidiphilus alkalitolerans TaxID=3342712 RepID=A0ABV6X118_9ACTN
MTAPATLVVDPDLLRAGRDGAKDILWNARTGQQVLLGPGAMGLLDRFAVPAAPGEAASAPLLRQLVELGLLVPHPAPGPAAGTEPPGEGLFGARRVDLAAALRDSRCDVVVVGIPYDVGVTGRPGARFGPHYLRNASRSLFRTAGLDDAPGMFDPVRGRQVLAGVRIADTGNITADVHTRNGDSLLALERTTAAVVGAGKFPVVLGGDHSITLPSVRGVLSARPEDGPGIGIIHFDAHLDFGRPRQGDWRQECHHGNFMDWLVGDPRVERLVQFGIRQLITRQPDPSPKVSSWPGVSAATADLERVLATLPEDIPYYVTIDVDFLDPLVMPSTGTPVAGGYSHLQAVELVEALCGRREIIGLDLVEFLPDGNSTAASTAAELLLRGLDGAFSARR